MMTKTEALKELFRDSNGCCETYYTFVEKLIQDELKESIQNLLKPDFDEFETPDNKSLQMSSLCQVLKYYSTRGDYAKFMKELQLED